MATVKVNLDSLGLVQLRRLSELPADSLHPSMLERVRHKLEQLLLERSGARLPPPPPPPPRDEPYASLLLASRGGAAAPPTFAHAMALWASCRRSFAAEPKAHRVQMRAARELFAALREEALHEKARRRVEVCLATLDALLVPQAPPSSPEREGRAAAQVRRAVAGEREGKARERGGRQREEGGRIREKGVARHERGVTLGEKGATPREKKEEPPQEKSVTRHERRETPREKGGHETSHAKGETSHEKGETSHATPGGEGDTRREKGVTPREKRATPHENGATPREKGVTSRENGVTPRENGETPRENGETPREKGETRREKRATPHENGVTSRQKGEMPREKGGTRHVWGETRHEVRETCHEGGETPLEKGEMPLEKGEMSRESGGTPLETGVTPREKGMRQEKGEPRREKGMTRLEAPHERESTPRDGDTPHTRGQTPCEKGLKPRGKTPRKKGETPHERGRKPRDDGVLPEEGTMLREEEVTPCTTGAPPRAKEVTPRETGATPCAMGVPPHERGATHEERVGTPRERGAAPFETADGNQDMVDLSRTPHWSRGGRRLTCRRTHTSRVEKREAHERQVRLVGERRRQCPAGLEELEGVPPAVEAAEGTYECRTLEAVDGEPPAEAVARIPPGVEAVGFVPPDVEAVEEAPPCVEEERVDSDVEAVDGDPPDVEPVEGVSPGEEAEERIPFSLAGASMVPCGGEDRCRGEGSERESEGAAAHSANAAPLFHSSPALPSASDEACSADLFMAISSMHQTKAELQARMELRAVLGDEADEVVEFIRGMVADAAEAESEFCQLQEEVVELLDAYKVSDASRESLSCSAAAIISAFEVAISSDDKPPYRPIDLASAAPAAARAHQPAAARVTTCTSSCDGGRGGRARPEADAQASPSPPRSAAQTEQLLQLMLEVMPTASTEMCEYVISRFGPCDEAVEALLSTPLQTIKSQMVAHAAEAMAAAAHDEYAEKSARKRIIRRYSSLPEPARGTPSHASRTLGSPTRRAPPLPYTGTRAETIRQKVPRYRDGQLVSYSSQKYGGSTASKFVEKPAWDGGSTGRVFLKRRGGVGSVMS